MRILYTTSPFQKDLKALPKHLLPRIDDTAQMLRIDPTSNMLGVKKLVGIHPPVLQRLTQRRILFFGSLRPAALNSLKNAGRSATGVVLRTVSIFDMLEAYEETFHRKQELSCHLSRRA
ncbi:hypothetical protein A3D69_01780 [Candidatus Uhrbacteria bacterium RIFCSPHIGHO2_02_FULL_54_11]|nr:MAG: hypothetical protein A3D69_01780 [Candidatus Uhrbacteria bacterium RIFCSPHIGHO2_02_FULL_54_11]